MAIVVSDTSPIRALGHLGLLDLLTTMYGQVYVPPAVVREISAAAAELSGWRGFHVLPPTNEKLVRRLRTGLHAGESEAIALAVELDADLVLMDEARGRAVAESLGLEIRGVLGVLLDAKARGLVPAVVPLIGRLKRELNFFLSSRLIARVMDLAGETDERP